MDDLTLVYLYYQFPSRNEEYFLATTFSPDDNEKYDEFIWNKAIKDQAYGAFYVDENEPINAFYLNGDEFDIPVKILIIDLDNKVKFHADQNNEMYLSTKVKSIIFLNKEMFHGQINQIMSEKDTIIIKRNSPKTIF